MTQAREVLPTGPQNVSGMISGPRDHINKRISQSGWQGQYVGDTRNCCFVGSSCLCGLLGPNDGLLGFVDNICAIILHTFGVQAGPACQPRTPLSLHGSVHALGPQYRPKVAGL